MHFIESFQLYWVNAKKENYETNQHSISLLNLSVVHGMCYFHQWEQGEVSLNHQIILEIFSKSGSVPITWTEMCSKVSMGDAGWGGNELVVGVQGESEMWRNKQHWSKEPRWLVVVFACGREH